MDFDQEQSKAERLHILKSCIEQAVLEFIRAMSPLRIAYSMIADTSRADQSVSGRVSLNLIWEEKKREVEVPFTVFYNRDLNVIEMTGYKKNVSRTEFPLDTDPDQMKDEITVSLTNLLIELIQA